MLACVQQLIDTALGEVGYLEKASNSNLDDKTANAGSNNYTKYARDLDAIENFYNGPKNGYAWCDVFVDWCFVQTFGVDLALALTCQPWGSTGAGVGYSKRFYEAKGQFYKSPKVGDQIFFVDSSGAYSHTGLVYNVDGSRVYTVEGNTSTASGVVANGGGVCQKSYALSYSRIAGYGRPDWSLVEENNVTKDQVISANRYLSLEEMKVNARYILQVLRADGWSLNAISGMLGNVQTESTINPGIWQSLDEGNTSGGYGLVQWTPATNYLNWCDEKGLDPSDMDSALSRIRYELENGGQYYATDEYPLSFEEFTISTKTPEYLAMVFLNNYERPADRDQPARGEQARFWFDYLSDYTSGGNSGYDGDDTRPTWRPETDADGNIHRKKKMALWLIVTASKRK